MNRTGKAVSAMEIVAMRDVMRHRGPDEEGLLVDGPVGLGHRRLSIIDLAGGRQPIGNEDGTVSIVFNGEIYNFGELRRDLEARGHQFTTRSDTEVIVHLYEELGVNCVDLLRGMFAFALWDANRRRLLLARDRLGIKPLYYAELPGSLLFASEIKSILQADGFNAEPDPKGLRRYLTYRHSYGSGTLFKGVRQLPPGHVLVADFDGTSVRQYWDVPLESVCDRPAERFIALLEDAVKLRMISDVPIGAFLSGGLDSSAVTALMARHATRVQTFSIGFVPGEENELSWASLVAEACAAEHREFVLGPEDFFSLLPRLVWHHDEPLTFPASIPLYLLSRESKPIATVMLAGEGADEILAGYDSNVRTYRLARLAYRLPKPLRAAVARSPLPPRMRAVAARAVLDEGELISSAYRLAGHEGLIGACRLELPKGAEDDEELLVEVGLQSRQGPFLSRLLYFQLKTYLVALLMKQDKMSMAASIETRVPYLDHHLVELAFTLPDEYKIRGRSGKYLLKQVSRQLLPREIITRPKRGFPVPIAQWFREPGSPFMETLLDPDTRRDGLLDVDFVQRRVNRFLAGEEISLELWSMLNLELWRREFFSPGAQRRVAA